MGQRSTPTPKIFFSRLKVKKLRFFRFWITFKCLSPLQILLVTITKTKKSPSPYVFCHRMRLKRRTTFPVIFSDRYDLKEACKHRYEVPGTNRKFFSATQAQASHSQKCNFFEIQKSVSVEIPFEWSPKPKNHYQLTFSVIGCDWNVSDTNPGTCKSVWGRWLR